MTYNSYQTASSRYSNPIGRYVGIGFVVALHVLIVWALLYALGTRALEVLKGPIQVSEIKDQKPEEKQPPPPPPKFEQPPPPYVPPPEISIQQSAPANTTAIAATTAKPVAAPPPAPPAPVTHTIVRATPTGKIEVTEADYPAVSKRLGEEGLALVIVTVGGDGQVLDAKIEKSSGFPRLDAKALDLVRRKPWKPGTDNGQPATTEQRVPIRFQLND